MSAATALASVLQLSISSGGLPKYPVLSAFATPLGLEGDRHNHPKFHGGPQQALLLVCAEAIAELTTRGYPLYPGALGENITTTGLDRRLLRLGSRLRAGCALLELTKIRAPCRALDIYGSGLRKQIYDRAVKLGSVSTPKWGLSGFYAAVLEPGLIIPGDRIAIIK